MAASNFPVAVTKKSPTMHSTLPIVFAEERRISKGAGSKSMHVMDAFGIIFRAERERTPVPAAGSSIDFGCTAAIHSAINAAIGSGVKNCPSASRRSFDVAFV